MPRAAVQQGKGEKKNRAISFRLGKKKKKAAGRSGSESNGLKSKHQKGIFLV